VLLAGAGCDTGIEERPLDFGSGEAWTGNGICYGPHRDGQRPGGEAPTDAQIAEDLAIMQEHWQVIRIFGASGFAERFLGMIHEQDSPVRVVLGIWIGPENPEDNRREIETGIRLANAFEDIVMAVAVANETQVDWSPNPIPVEELIAGIREVRAAVTQPVTTPDAHDYWNQPESRRVADEVDFLFVHAHPLWNGQQIEDGLGWLQAALDGIREIHPGRSVVVGETGWATSMHPDGDRAGFIKGKPGEPEQKIFYGQVRAWAAETEMPTFWFEAFDENWKGGPHPDEVEKHWGLYRADRTPKAVFNP
jgi:exo-beta-1,3-glucanase (GH17 family)